MVIYKMMLDEVDEEPFLSLSEELVLFKVEIFERSGVKFLGILPDGFFSLREYMA